MFEKFKKTSQLDRQIDAVANAMDIYGPESPEFETLLTRLERLKKIQAEERSTQISGDTAVIAGANVLSILIMVAYERANVMTSKSLGMLLRTKLN